MRILRAKVPYIRSLSANVRQQIFSTKSSFTSGTGSCPGCGGMLAVRLASQVINYAAERLNAQVVHTQQTGCIQVTVSSGDLSASQESYLHASFSDGPSVLRGIIAAYEARRAFGENLPLTLFWNFSGDGGTYNIGMRSFSGFLQNGRGLLLIYDNRGYMNTGAQWSSSTFPGEKRTTAQVGAVKVGADEFPKDLVGIAADHDVPYVASASLGTQLLVRDFMRKILIGITLGLEAPAVVVVDAPCPREQKFSADKTNNVGKLAVETGAFRVLEVINGKWIINAQRKKEGESFLPVESFLASQGNLSHLLRPENRPIVERLQAYINNKWEEAQLREAATANLALEDLTIPLEKVLGL